MSWFSLPMNFSYTLLMNSIGRIEKSYKSKNDNCPVAISSPCNNRINHVNDCSGILSNSVFVILNISPLNPFCGFSRYCKNDQKSCLLFNKLHKSSFPQYFGTLLKCKRTFLSIKYLIKIILPSKAFAVS